MDSGWLRVLGRFSSKGIGEFRMATLSNAAWNQLRGVLSQSAVAQRGRHQEEGEIAQHRGDQSRRRRRRRTQRSRAAQLLSSRTTTTTTAGILGCGSVWPVKKGSRILFDNWINSMSGFNFKSSLVRICGVGKLECLEKKYHASYLKCELYGW